MDQLEVPDNTILFVTENDDNNDLALKLIEPLKGKKKRDWFVKHAYYCLPLTIANQYGFIVKSLYDIWVTWNGGYSADDVTVRKNPDDIDLHHRQHISAHFGMGIVTIQNCWTFRTPKGINLMTINPPNYWLDGISHMMSVRSNI